MDFISEDAVLAVKRGIYWLDENHPGWAERIDLDELDMGECETCVIGQSVGSYSTVVHRQGSDFAQNTAWAVEHGFEQPRAITGYDEYRYMPVNYSYGELETLWSDEVRKRLG